MVRVGTTDEGETLCISLSSSPPSSSPPSSSSSIPSSPSWPWSSQSISPQLSPGARYPKTSKLSFLSFIFPARPSARRPDLYLSLTKNNHQGPEYEMAPPNLHWSNFSQLHKLDCDDAGNLSIADFSWPLSIRGETAIASDWWCRNSIRCHRTRMTMTRWRWLFTACFSTSSGSQSL